VIAFLDRIHAYLPGWELPKLSPHSYARDYGFIADYFCEIMHELRRTDLMGSVRGRFELVDVARTPQGVSGRDQRAVLKSISGMLKLLYPDGHIEDETLEEVLLLACELRQRVRDQLHLIAPGEYDRVTLGVRLTATDSEIAPTVPESGRVQRITARQEPAVGEVTGLSVSGDLLLHLAPAGPLPARTSCTCRQGAGGVRSGHALEDGRAAGREVGVAAIGRIDGVGAPAHRAGGEACLPAHQQHRA
jgi:hypothetical protein